MKYVFYRVTDQPTIDILDDINGHHLFVTFDLPNVDADEEHMETLLNMGVPANIAHNEETENCFSIIKDDYPTEQDIHNELRKYGLVFDPNWTP